MCRTTVFLREKQADALERVAREMGVSQSELIRRALDMALACPEEREAFARARGAGVSK